MTCKFTKKANANDPLQKREEFAVSLRKKKKEGIIRDKRMRLIMNTQTVGAVAPKKSLYQGCSLFPKEGPGSVKAIVASKIPDLNQELSGEESFAEVSKYRNYSAFFDTILPAEICL